MLFSTNYFLIPLMASIQSVLRFIRSARSLCMRYSGWYVLVCYSCRMEETTTNVTGIRLFPIFRSCMSEDWTNLVYPVKVVQRFEIWFISLINTY